MPSLDMSLCFSNEQVVSFWGDRSPLWIFRWLCMWIQEALLSQQDYRALGLRPSCVVRWQLVFIGTWFNSYAGSRETLVFLDTGGLCCSKLEVSKQTASTGWTQSQELCIQKCLGVSFGVFSGPLEGERLFTSLCICIHRMMRFCVFSCIRAVLQKHLVVRSKKKKILYFFLQSSYCTKDLI